MHRLTRLLFTVICFSIFPISAYADGLTVTNQDDFSVQFFKLVFGDVANLMLGNEISITSPDTVMGELMMVWNSFLHVIAVTFVLWNGSMWMIKAGIGEQKEYDSFGLPIRFLMTLVGCVPFSHGYSASQLLNFYGAAASIEQANNLSEIVYDNMNAGGNLTQFGSLIDHDELIQNLFMSHVCMLLINDYEGEQVIDRTNANELSAEEAETEGVISFEYPNYYTKYTMSFGEDSWWGTYDEKECGSYSFRYNGGDINITDGDPEYDFSKNIFTVTKTLDDSLSTTANDFITNIWGEDKITLEEDGKRTTEYQALLTSTLESIESAKSTYVTSVYSAIEEYQTERETYLEENQDAVPSFTENFSASEIGWMALGATYMLQSIQTQAGMQFVKDNMFTIDAKVSSDAYAIEDIQSAMRASAELVGVSTYTGTNDVESVEELKNKTSSWVANMAVDLVNSEDDPVMSILEYGHNMIATGETVIGLLAAIKIIKEMARMEGQEETTSIPPLSFAQNLKRLAAVSVAVLLSDAISGIISIAFALILIGAFFAFYVPAIPLIHWIGVALGAVIANVINIILAPLHVVAHAFSEGRGVFAHQARQGYFIMFSAQLRFPLAVLGFIAVYPLILGAGKFVILLYTPYVSSMITGKFTGIVTFIALTALLGTLLVGAIERCCNVMHELTDSAMRMIGHSIESMQGASIANSSQGRFSSDYQQVTKAGLEPMSKMPDNEAPPTPKDLNADLR
jgi:conjugal transfer/type IV secretion protein DotA/TraY